MATTMKAGAGKGWKIALWAAQLVLAAMFGLVGVMKATQPLGQLAPTMAWVQAVSPCFVRALGVAELLGAVGLVLPSLTRIRPRFTVAAAVCLAVVQVLAIGLHASRGETAHTIGLNLVLLALALFVWWGRDCKVPIASRWGISPARAGRPLRPRSPARSG